MTQTAILGLFLPVYGVAMMAMLLDIRPEDVTPKRLLLLAAFAAAVVGANIMVFRLGGRVLYSQLYIVLVQIPVACGLGLLSRYRGLRLLFTLLTVIALSAPPVKLVVALRILSNGNGAFMLAGFAVGCLGMVALVWFFFRSSYLYMLANGTNKDFAGFCVIPLLYYLYGIWTTSYDFMQYESVKGFFMEDIPSLIVLAAYLLMLDIFKRTREREILRTEQTMLHAQLDIVLQQIAAQREAQNCAAIYRHDLRHHFALLNGFLAQGEAEKAQQYLRQAQAGLDAVTPVCYCENSAVNLIVSYFADKARENGVALEAKIELPQGLSLPETELCAILSNGLENALAAAAGLPQGTPRTVRLHCTAQHNKLLLQIENPCCGTVPMRHGVPLSQHKDHGFGCQSIAAIAQKHKGFAAFAEKDGFFTLRVMLAMENEPAVCARPA